MATSDIEHLPTNLSDVEHMPMDFSDLDDRFMAFFVLGSHDYDAQLRAIHDFLRLRKEADERFDRELKEIEAFTKRAKGSASQQGVDEWVDHLHGGVFQDAAHSMAAVGMLAPFVESLFNQAFFGIGERLQRNVVRPKEHPRWNMDPKKQWDCHYVASSTRKNLIEGIFELAELTNLAPHLPANLRKTLDALFGYRNKMFHHGFEWPKKEREKFEKRIAADGWPPEWFDKAESDHRPWIFYLSYAFVDHCLATIEGVLEGLGAFVRKN